MYIYQLLLTLYFFYRIKLVLPPDGDRVFGIDVGNGSFNGLVGFLEKKVNMIIQVKQKACILIHK